MLVDHLSEPLASLHLLDSLGIGGEGYPNLALLQQCAGVVPEDGFGGLAMLGSYPDLENLTLLQAIQKYGVGADDGCLTSLALLGLGGLPMLTSLQAAAGDSHYSIVCAAEGGGGGAAPAAAAAPPAAVCAPYLELLGCPAGRPGLGALQGAAGADHLARVSAQPASDAGAAQQAAAAPPAQYSMLELLGCAGEHRMLGELQAAAGEEHHERVGLRALRRSVDASADPAARPPRLSDSDEVMQGPAGRALRQREDELRRREDALAERERALAARECQLVVRDEDQSPRRPPPSPHKQAAQDAGVLIDDEDLRELFATYDRNGNGFVSKTEFKNEYRQFEDYGLPLTDRQLDSIFAQFGGDDDRLSYAEFSILMLQRAKI